MKEEILKKVESILGGHYSLWSQSKLCWLFKDGKCINRIDLNYCEEMDKRGELEKYLNEIIQQPWN